MLQAAYKYVCAAIRKRFPPGEERERWLASASRLYMREKLGQHRRSKHLG